MSNYIKDRAGLKKMEINAITFFNHMTDDDFIIVHNAGQLKNLCDALSIDLQNLKYEKNNTYTA